MGFISPRGLHIPIVTIMKQHIINCVTCIANQFPGMELDWCGIAHLINTMTYRPKLSVIMLGQYHLNSVVALETQIFCFFILLWNRIFFAELLIYVLCLRTTVVCHCMSYYLMRETIIQTK